MLPTPEFAERIERERWEPDPETAATLRWLIIQLNAPESDGKSMLERVYLTCQHENQRVEEVQNAGFALLGKRFKDKYVFFQADCPPDTRIRFKLKIADNHRDLARVPAATGEVFLNLLRPKEDWILPPKRAA